MTAVAPREVFCVTEHEHRDRDAADGVLAGRFTVAGETRALGTPPDWLEAALPADDPTELIRRHAVPRLQELGRIVDEHGRPWHEKT